MIELNEKTQQDFLNREWVQKLLDAGVDMSDAKYKLIRVVWGNPKIYITMANIQHEKLKYKDICPTYTVSELLYKLHEWIYPTIDGKKYSGGLTMIKDAPFYIFYYDLERKEEFEGDTNLKKDTYIHAPCDYPIESLASLLIQCHTKDIGIDRKDTGDISDK